MVFTYIVAAVVLLGLCIFVHELGHLLGGKMVGIKARVFSIGYGKGFIKKKIGDTTYQLTLIPFGGYCQFYGEDPSEERSGEGYEFLSAHPLRRIVTVAMGPFFNLFFGILIFFTMNIVGYEKETNKVYIPEQFKSGKYVSAAFEAGIQNGDRIIQIGDRKISSFSDIQTNVVFSDGKTLAVTVSRDGKEKSFQVNPQQYTTRGKYEIGVMPYGSSILVAELVDNEAAEEAGLQKMDEIVSLDGVEVHNEVDFVQYINSHGGRPVRFKFKRDGHFMEMSVTPRLSDVVKFQRVDKDGKRGEETTISKSEAVLKIIKKGHLRIEGERIISYDELLETVKKYDGKEIEFKVDKDTFKGFARIERVGLIGIYHIVAPEKVEVKYGPVEALAQSFIEPYEFIVLNLKGIGMLFAGKMNVRENLSGPIMIAKIAGDVAYYKGIPDFILLMAKISIILMVMNLLPIPVVDGSHLIFFLIEAIRGKPLSQKVMERIQTVGIVLLIMLGAFVIVNDISKLPFIQDLFN